MTNAVFQTKVGSNYDDVPEERYHFPRQYLGRVERTVGDKIIYYEPRSGGGRLAYFAVAEVVRIDPDPNYSDHYYARIRNYLNFDRPVWYRERGGYESMLFRKDGTVNPGAAQNAVRLLPDREFEAILEAGLSSQPAWPDRSDAATGFEEEQAAFERPLVEVILNRRYRDAKFRQHVQIAYDRRCALTGLRIINGQGRPEVEAAHIKPVAAHGPDSIRNGIALSGTVHWMFDRGLLSLRDDFSILCSRHLNSDISHLLTKDLKAIVPSEPRFHPHPLYLEYHRDCVFKQ